MFKLDGGLLLWGLCVVVLSVGSVFEGGRMRGWGQGRDVFGCALMRALAGMAGPPCTLHLKEVTFLAWRLLPS